MIITEKGLWKLEEGEYDITSNAIMSSLVAYWLASKRYTIDDLEQKGLPWSCDVGESVEPRELFNYIYISQMVRDGHTSPPSYYWIRLADGTLRRGEKAPLWKKVENMYKVLEKYGWSQDSEKSKWGSMTRAAEELGWSTQTLRNYIKKYPETPEPPWGTQFARMVLDYYEKAREKIGGFWFWKASHLLPPQYGGQNYIPEVPLSDFMKFNEGKKELDFSILDDMYKEFSMIKFVRYSPWEHMVITKGDVKITDLRKPPLSGTTFIDRMRYELTGESPKKKEE